MLPQAVKLKGIALDLLFPRHCVGCGKEGDFFCLSCRQLLEPIKPPICPLCGIPQKNGTPCSSCVEWKTEIDGMRSPFKFEGVIRQAIHHLKYQNLRAMAAPLAELLTEYLNDNPLPADALMPVPLHHKRLRERGYNQSRLIARELEKHTGFPVIDDCLARQRHTSPQARTGSAAERRHNVENAFTCCNERAKGRQVLLIDDVSTSGATLSACAAALKEAGAASVWGLTIAREI